ncbi:MAG: winged helix-turn-helix domain-containing protein [Candidatus Bathyarchaeota archaeon]|nr:winged helix-turn-helix domain-containing protein [Candidatus Bathyarchaeota archaeon]
MPPSKELIAAQQFMTRNLLSYEDELFGLLYRDIDDFAAKQTPKIVTQRRTTSVYGPRGVGKTAAIQGVLLQAIEETAEDPIIPITITVKGANTASNIKELNDVFFRSVLSGILDISTFKRRENTLKEGIKKYAPWVAGKMTEVASIVFPPLGLASDASEKGVKWLVGQLHKPDIESILASTETDTRHAVDILIRYLEESGQCLVFSIDELDKVPSDTLLSDFFDGNQAWFQGKQGIISLTYTFGESIKDTVASSVKRFSTVEKYNGVAKLTDAENIILSRAYLGVSQVCQNEKATNEMIRAILPTETIRAILNVSAPNTFQMLERTYSALQKAIDAGSKTVTPVHVLEEETETLVPTQLEQTIMSELSKGRLTPSDLSEQLEKHSSSIVRALQEMMRKRWVTRVGKGKRAYYSLTMRGDAAVKRCGRSP